MRSSSLASPPTACCATRCRTPPSGSGVGARLSEGQIRLRVADNLRVNPNTVMPSYYKVDGLDRVAGTYAGKPVLTAQEVEDVVAWLTTLR